MSSKPGPEQHKAQRKAAAGPFRLPKLTMEIVQSRQAYMQQAQQQKEHRWSEQNRVHVSFLSTIKPKPKYLEKLPDPVLICLPDIVAESRKRQEGVRKVPCRRHTWQAERSNYELQCRFCLSPDARRAKRLLSFNLYNIPAGVDVGNITHLCLSNHLIPALPPPLAHCSQLKVLIMDGNQLATLDKGILKKLPWLRVLSLKNNKLLSSMAIAAELQGNLFLQDLNISNNPCMTTEEYPEELVIHGLPWLRTLNGKSVTDSTRVNGDVKYLLFCLQCHLRERSDGK